MKVSSLLLFVCLVGLSVCKDENERFVDVSIRMPNLPVTIQPGLSQAIYCQIFDLPDDAPYDAIQFTPQIDSPQNVFFFSLYAIKRTPVFEGIGILDKTVYPTGYVPNCWELETPQLAIQDIQWIYGWANGTDGRMRFDVNEGGMPLGNQSDFNRLYLQISYTNAANLSETTFYDQTGVDIRLTTKLRDRQIGLITTGIEDEAIQIATYETLYILNTSVTTPSPYLEVSGEEGLEEGFVAVSDFKEFFDILGVDSVNIIRSIGHTNLYGRFAELYFWRGGAAPGLVNTSSRVYQLPVSSGSPPYGIAELVDRIDRPTYADKKWHTISTTLNRGDSFSMNCAYDTTKPLIPGHFTQNDSFIPWKAYYGTDGELCNFQFYYSIPRAQAGTFLSRGFNPLMVDNYRVWQGSRRYLEEAN
jgi:hypothetical protein